MSCTYCHTHSKYDCPTCADEILSLGIQADKDRIKWLESEVARLEACAAQAEPEEKPDFEKLESLGWQIAICAMCGTHAAAIKPAQSVQVVGEPVAWVNINKHGDITRTVRRRDNWCTTPVVVKPKTSIPAAELASLREKAARLEAERSKWQRNSADNLQVARDLIAERDEANARLHDVSVACATAEQERDELRKDAERYRIALLPAQSKLNAASQPATHPTAKEYLIAEAREIIDAAIAQGKVE